MSKLDRITGKVFGATASPTGDADNGPYIGQFGSAKLGTYNGTSDIATIQSLSAWSNGWIDAVTPTNQYPPLPERTGVDKVLSYQECYLLQSGVAEWDENTDYYTGNFCRVNDQLYVSLVDNNTNNYPIDDDSGSWKKFSPGERYLIEAGNNGSSWYRLYSDTWKEQGGVITSQATELPWNQPIIESNASNNSGTLTAIGVMGGNSFAVSCSWIRNANAPLSSAFDGVVPSSGSTSTAYFAAAIVGTSTSGGNWIKVYTPTPILVSEIDVFWSAASTALRTTTLIIQGSNNGEDWTTLSSGTTSQTSGSGYATIKKHAVDLSSVTTKYKYFRIQNTTPFVPSQVNLSYWYVCEIRIIAEYTASASTGVTYPLEFDNSNHTALLTVEGSAPNNTYIASKTSTGFTLGNAPTGIVNWFACGY